MELTLEQALQKGIEAHRAGQVQEADRYYTAILKANPKHPDANHNMGVLAVGVGKVTEALPFFKTALEVNPKTDQYWLSYIDALIKLDRMDDAKAVLDQAKSNGAKGDGFDQIQKRFITPPINDKDNSTDQDETNILDTLKLDKAIKLAQKKTQQGSLDEAHRIYQDILKKFPKNKRALNGIKILASKTLANSSEVDEPSSDQLQTLINLYIQRQYQEALVQTSQLLKQFPGSVNLYNLLGVVNQGLGKVESAIEAYKKAILIQPNCAEAYNNMGNALREKVKPDQAIRAFKKAISIKPDYAMALSNMGVTLHEQGKIDEAIKVFKKAMSIDPDYVETYNNMGNALTDLGKLKEAIEVYKNALALNPDHALIYNNMGNVLNKQDKPEEAIDAYRKALSIEPDYASAKHMISALTGEKVQTAPNDYVENLFDGYAKKFETELINKLEYNSPKIVRDILVEPNKKLSLGSILDLGCGTGLFGSEIRDHCSQLEGIDLSSNMLEIAKQKNIYDKLTQFNIVDYLSSMPVCFDYYIAVDVFVYVGELSEIFRLIKSRNKKPGKLAFTTEHTELDGYHLLKTGRYSHSKSYIESLCKKFDYNMFHFSTVKLRKESKHYLTGGVYILEFTNKI